MDAKIFELVSDLAVIAQAAEGMNDDGTFTIEEQMRLVLFMQAVTPQLVGQVITHKEAFDAVMAKYCI